MVDNFQLSLLIFEVNFPLSTDLPSKASETYLALDLHTIYAFLALDGSDALNK